MISPKGNSGEKMVLQRPCNREYIMLARWRNEQQTAGLQPLLCPPSRSGTVFGFSQQQLPGHHTRSAARLRPDSYEVAIKYAPGLVI